jgi:hypothetical protein
MGAYLPRDAGEGDHAKRGGGGGANSVFTLPGEKGCAPLAALLKGAL